jgi:hypothetical protein
MDCQICGGQNAKTTLTGIPITMEDRKTERLCKKCAADAVENCANVLREMSPDEFRTL